MYFRYQQFAPRRKHIRLRNYDYSSDGFYFVTINTKNRQNYFGEIRSGVMGLNEFGLVAQKCWLEIPKHFPFVGLDEFVVMPDHVHGILVIRSPVWTRHGASIRGNSFGPLQKNSVASIINHYKGAVKRWSNKNNHHFFWHGLYYDRIIRNEIELNNVRRYIQNNPQKWSLKKRT